MMNDEDIADDASLAEAERKRGAKAPHSPIFFGMNAWSGFAIGAQL